MFECACAQQNFYAEWFKSMYLYSFKGRNATSTASPDKLGNLPLAFSKRSQAGTARQGVYDSKTMLLTVSLSKN